MATSPERSPLWFQALKYLDYIFTGVFTFEMVIKVRCRPPTACVPLTLPHGPLGGVTPWSTGGGRCMPAGRGDAPLPHTSLGTAPRCRRGPYHVLAGFTLPPRKRGSQHCPVPADHVGGPKLPLEGLDVRGGSGLDLSLWPFLAVPERWRARCTAARAEWPTCPRACLRPRRSSVRRARDSGGRGHASTPVRPHARELLGRCHPSSQSSEPRLRDVVGPEAAALGVADQVPVTPTSPSSCCRSRPSSRARGRGTGHGLRQSRP